MTQKQRERILTYFLFSYKLTQQILKAKDTNRQVERQMVFTSRDSGRIIRVQSDRPEGAKNQHPHFQRNSRHGPGLGKMSSPFTCLDLMKVQSIWA